MSREVVVAVFERPEELLAAGRAARARGLRLVDAYTPYPVHGLEALLGLPPTRLPLVAFVCGLIGVVFMLWFQLWTSAVDWRLNVGGRPWNSSLAFLAVTFEVMVLFAGGGTVLAFLLRSRLWPGRVALPPAAGLADDRFALVLEQPDAALERDEVAELLVRGGALHVEERVLDHPGCGPGCPCGGPPVAGRGDF